MKGQRITGARIKALRTERDLSIGQLALYASVDGGTLSRLENGKVTTSADKLAEIARALRTTTDYLLGLSNDPIPPRERQGKEAALAHALWLAETDESVKRILLALPAIPADQLRMLALFVETIRQAALEGTAPSVPTNE